MRLLSGVVVCAAMLGCTVVDHAVIWGPDDPFVRLHRGMPSWHGFRYPIVGLNAYTLASGPPSDRPWYCGHYYGPEGIDEVLAATADLKGTTVRLFATRRLTADGTDFSRIDDVISRAKAAGVRLILVLENRDALCSDAGVKTSAWYLQALQGTDAGGLPYREYVRKIARRYRDEPTVLMWQLMHHASLPDAGVLRRFAREMSYVLKAADGNHLVSLGAAGYGWPGLEPGAYESIAAIPWIDVVDGAIQNVEKRSLSMDAVDKCVVAAMRYKKACIVSDVGEGIALKRDSTDRALAHVIRHAAASRAATRGIDGLLLSVNGIGDPERTDIEAMDPFMTFWRRAGNVIRLRFPS